MLNAALAEREPSLGRADWILAVTLGLMALAGMEAYVLTVRPGYLSFTDCVPYIIQAEIFHSGHLTRPPPEKDIRQFVRTSGMVWHQGHEFSRQPPGASAVFAMLMPLVGDVRFAPPLLSAVAVALNFLWIRRIHDRRTALWAAVPCILGPVYLQTGASILSYGPSALFLSLAMVAFTGGLARPTLGPAALAGVCIGLQFACRPYSAILSALGLAVMRGIVFRDRPRLGGQMLAFAAGLVPGVGLFLIHNRLVTDAWWPLAFTVYCPHDRIGFGLRGLGGDMVTHTPARALTYTLLTLRGLAWYFFGFYLWLVPLVVWVLGRAVRGRRSTIGRWTRWDVALAVIPAALILGHMLYWYPRTVSYFDATPFIAALIARGICTMIDSGRERRWTAYILVALPVFFGTWLAGRMISEEAAPIRAIHTLIRQRYEAEGPLLVFLRAGKEPLTGEGLEGESGGGPVFHGLINHSLSDDEPVIYAVDHKAADLLVVSRYRTRRHYVLLLSPARNSNGVWTGEPVLLPLSRYLDRFR